MVEEDRNKADPTYEVLVLPELKGKNEIEAEIVDIMGEKKWISLNEKAIAEMEHNGDGNIVREKIRVMGCHVYIRRGLITEIERQLKELSMEFPGERMKDVSVRSAIYNNKREHLLSVREYLFPMQREEKGKIRHWFSEVSERRKETNIFGRPRFPLS
ncbi:MAG: hypothetical protein A3B47_02670 [Candidatus Levybacteria bacterium RIFCSPLOWO2_01_FULL_39_24]|nr:MAG: hypothetical protein A2800_01960 [Candidatus Levybacteria bacterium RIFCSPHIGHO2_01_FULL_40_16]OGH46524.1 MAG: hypothetical protein A3B47_02670 [Candidatus Levybacteria bacterium RIFCSPLOWO2_01_FULL_39_24]